MESRTWSQNKRWELANILSSVLNQAGIDDETRTALEMCRQEIAQSTPEVVLVSAGTKPAVWTFNALCNGLPILASDAERWPACVVAAENLPEAGEESCADIQWFSERELASLAVSALRGVWQGIQERGRFRPFPLDGDLHFGDRNGRQAFDAAVTEIWRRWEETPGGDAAELEVLRFAALAPRFYDSPDYAGFHRVKRVSSTEDAWRLMFLP